jgi:hypothetical protein
VLTRKAYEAHPEGGAYIVYESIGKRVWVAAISLNTLLETAGGFDYARADCIRWMKEARFRETRVDHLTGSDSMAIGIK